MANEKNLKPFKHGNPGGPGRPKNPPELKEVQQMTKGQYQLLMHRLMSLKPEELGGFKGTLLEMALASIIQHAIKTGDQSRLTYFTDRLFGKVKDEVEIRTFRKVLRKLDGTEIVFTNEEEKGD